MRILLPFLVCLVLSTTIHGSTLNPSEFLIESDAEAWLGERDCPHQCDSACSCISNKPNCDAFCQKCMTDGIPCGLSFDEVPASDAASNQPFQQNADILRLRAVAPKHESTESSRNKTEHSESSRSTTSKITPVRSSSSSSHKTESSTDKNPNLFSSPTSSSGPDKQAKLNQVVDLQSKIIKMLQQQSAKQKEQLAAQQKLLDEKKRTDSAPRVSESSKPGSTQSNSSHTELPKWKREELLKKLHDIIGANSAALPFFTSDSEGIQLVPITLPVALPTGSSIASMFGGASSSSTTADLKSSHSSSTSSQSDSKPQHEARLNRMVQILEQLVSWVRQRRAQVGESSYGSEKHVAEVLEQAASLAARH